MSQYGVIVMPEHKTYVKSGSKVHSLMGNGGHGPIVPMNIKTTEVCRRLSFILL